MSGTETWKKLTSIRFTTAKFVTYLFFSFPHIASEREEINTYSQGAAGEIRFIIVISLLSPLREKTSQHLPVPVEGTL